MWRRVCSGLLSPEVMQDRPLYKQLVVNGTRFKLKACHSAWCNPSVCWEARLMAGLWGLEPKGFLANMMRNHWKRWVSILQSSGIPEESPCARVATACGRTHYMRSLPEHSVSSVALLLLSAWRVFSSRGDGTRGHASDFLAAFLMLFFSGEDVELMVVTDQSLESRVGCVHSMASVSIPIDSGRVFLKPLLEALPPERARSFHDILVAEGFASQESCGVVRIHEFMLSVFASKERWLVKQVFGQVGKFIDVLIHERSFSPRPLSAAEDSPSLPKHARRDKQLVHKLALVSGRA